MKKWISLCLVLMLLGCTTALATEDAATTGVGESPKADWTVMFYLCGTDLESNYGMATYNLKEISQTKATDNVHMVIETGGSREWKAKEELGLDIATDKLQRYHYGPKGFTLKDEQPLANMAAPGTLSDFIKWSVQAYPAQKYMLVLWDHGGGSMRGLIMDELHNDAIMPLEDLGYALQDANVHFENIATDTCLMASLETAQAIAPYANYFIASEEVVPGEGSAYQGWLQYLYNTPSCLGDRLGKVFCDLTQQKYAELGQDASSRILTYSVIDLSKIGAVSAAFEKMFAQISTLLENPDDFLSFGYFTRNSERYYFPTMIDLVDLASRARGAALSNETVSAVQEAVDDAVVYSIRGSGRTYSNGLSFYYEPTASPSTLDHYARNAKNPTYLAFLDAVNMNWTAPAWVYEQVERLPDITREDYIVESETSVSEDGHYQMNITNAKSAVAAVDSVLYKYDKESDNWLLLGRNFDVDGDFENGVFVDQFNGMWPTLDGVPCQISMLEETVTHNIYEIPCMMDMGEEEPEPVMLRAGYVYDVPLDQSLQTTATQEPAVPDEAAAATDEAAAVPEEAAAVPDEKAQSDDSSEPALDPYSGSYALYGVWDGYSSSVNMPNRNITDLKGFYGHTIQPMLTVMSLSGEALGMVPSGKVKLNDKTDIVNQLLSKGKYAYAFVIIDVFGKEHISTPAYLNWNGKTATFQPIQ
ncbi:MAG: clostripain-related cysteine peptidase [Clostridia bacterium]